LSALNKTCSTRTQPWAKTNKWYSSLLSLNNNKFLFYCFIFFHHEPGNTKTCIVLLYFLPPWTKKYKDLYCIALFYSSTMNQEIQRLVLYCFIFFHHEQRNTKTCILLLYWLVLHCFILFHHEPRNTKSCIVLLYLHPFQRKDCKTLASLVEEFETKWISLG
jgi:hypothetical protein